MHQMGDKTSVGPTPSLERATLNAPKAKRYFASVQDGFQRLISGDLSRNPATAGKRQVVDLKDFELCQPVSTFGRPIYLNAIADLTIARNKYI